MNETFLELATFAREPDPEEPSLVKSGKNKGHPCMRNQRTGKIRPPTSDELLRHWPERAYDPNNSLDWNVRADQAAEAGRADEEAAHRKAALLVERFPRAMMRAGLDAYRTQRLPDASPYSPASGHHANWLGVEQVVSRLNRRHQHWPIWEADVFDHLDRLVASGQVCVTWEQNQRRTNAVCRVDRDGMLDRPSDAYRQWPEAAMAHLLVKPTRDSPLEPYHAIADATRTALYQMAQGRNDYLDADQVRSRVEKTLHRRYGDNFNGGVLPELNDRRFHYFLGRMVGAGVIRFDKTLGTPHPNLPSNLVALTPEAFAQAQKEHNP